MAFFQCGSDEKEIKEITFSTTTSATGGSINPPISNKKLLGIKFDSTGIPSGTGYIGLPFSDYAGNNYIKVFDLNMQAVKGVAVSGVIYYAD